MFHLLLLLQSDVEKIFCEYGDIDYVRIIRDRNTNKSKGLAYVKYYRAYCAAVALEKCGPGKTTFSMITNAKSYMLLYYVICDSLLQNTVVHSFYNDISIYY